jgi:hypothetical protein
MNSKSNHRAGPGWRLVARLVVVAIAVAVPLGASSESAAAPAEHDWYWTPALCKSLLQQHGMELADGRRFFVANAFCVGLGGSQNCMWSSGRRYRLYAQFVAFTRSYDGAVRTFDLRTTDRRDYSATNIRLLGHEPSVARFRALIAPLASSLARQQHGKGCAPYR